MPRVCPDYSTHATASREIRHGIHGKPWNVPRHAMGLFHGMPWKVQLLIMYTLLNTIFSMKLAKLRRVVSRVKEEHSVSKTTLCCLLFLELFDICLKTVLRVFFRDFFFRIVWEFSRFHDEPPNLTQLERIRYNKGCLFCFYVWFSTFFPTSQSIDFFCFCFKHPSAFVRAACPPGVLR